MIIYRIGWLIFFWGIASLQAQNKKVLDSLNLAYQNASKDQKRYEILLRIGQEYVSARPDSTINKAKTVLRWAEAQKNFALQAESNYWIGTAIRNKGKVEEAIEYLQKAQTLFERLQDKKGVGKTLNIRGAVYESLGNYKEALTLWQRSANLFEEIRDAESQAGVLTSIGVVHRIQGDYAQALQYYNKALQKFEEAKKILPTSQTYNNIGNVYFMQKDYHKALEYYQKSLQIKEKLASDKRSISISIGNVGRAYAKLGQFDKAFERMNLALKYSEETSSARIKLNILNGIAEAYLMQNKYAEAAKIAHEAEKLAKELKVVSDLSESYDLLYQSYKGVGKMQEALDYFEKSKIISDSLFAIDKAKTIANLEAKDALSKKEKQIALIEKDNELNRLTAEQSERELEISKKQNEADRLRALAMQEKDKRKADSLRTLAQKAQTEAENLRIQAKLEEENRRIKEAKQKEEKEFQNIRFYFVLAGMAGLLIFAGFVLRSRQVQQKLNQQLQSNNQELQNQREELQVMNEELTQTQEEIVAQHNFIEEQNHSLSYQNTQIKHSINTAMTIQKALLPFDERVRGFLKDYFVLYEPRDIVSGDFYWIEKIDSRIVIVVGDCTGHGVPGAFMSLIGINLLERVVLQQETTQPVQILNDLHDLVRLALKQESLENQSGMDLGVVMMQYNKEGVATLTFAGAKRPLYYAEAGKDKGVQVIAGSRKSVGGMQSEVRIFEETQFSLPPNSMIYMSSDGLADQNNIKRKRLGEKPIVETLSAHQHEALHIQQKALTTLLQQHMEGTEQRDDIILLGIKI